MYHEIKDKQFLHKMRQLSGEILQHLCHNLKEDYDIGSTFYLVGSGARNLILQNANDPIDLDYNLEIVKCEDFNDCVNLKECVRKSFNKALKKYRLQDCEDSTSCLTSKRISFKQGNSTSFSIDICITYKPHNKGVYYRLIHDKRLGRYYWNQAPNSDRLQEKVAYIKKQNAWEEVRKQYIDIKNRYLKLNDHYHPSFICYTEAVNNIYNHIRPVKNITEYLIDLHH